MHPLDPTRITGYFFALVSDIQFSPGTPDEMAVHVGASESVDQWAPSCGIYPANVYVRVP
ncbi:MAG: hypothetical protein JWN30_1807 [Bacilli bacterium]|nr:hypothetical protein [Bacilli bacterium]